MSVEIALGVAVLATFAAWVALTRHILQVQRLRIAARNVLTRTVTTLERPEVCRLDVAERIKRARPILDAASRELIMRAAASRQMPDETFAVVAGYLRERWSAETLVRDASAHRSARDKWRRITALRILARLEHPERLDLLARALRESDQEVAAVALALVGAMDDPRATDILFEALRRQVHPASRVAVYLDRSRQSLAERLQSLTTDPDPAMRLWSATLLARYPSPALESLLAPLTSDSDARVRKAAIQTLGGVGDQVAAECAERLLADPMPYVRAHAARALAELGRSDRAEAVSPLLGDANWWVRLAAKESLTSMGSDVWPVLMRSLGHSDQFVRNGAAEVFQNLGVLDSLIVMEAASDNPSQTKIDMLHRIAAAGGMRFTDSLVERAGAHIGPRIRQLLTTIGLERVEAHR